MFNYSYYLKIAGLVIQIESPVPIFFLPCMEPFQILNSEKVDLSYKIEWTTGFHFIEEEIYKGDYSVFIKDGKYIRERTLWAAEQIESVFLESLGQAGSYNLFVSKKLLENSKLFVNSNILHFLALEQGLLENNAFMLHSSFVSYFDNGILFTAPSGTGKSTQADLWHQYEGAEIYNGDRTIVRKIDGIYHGFGSPYAGSSGIYRNETAPVRAIVVLTQAPENHIEQLTGKNAFVPLYRETLMNTWNPAYMEKMTDLLMDAAANIPVYHLACRPDRGAVDLVKKTLFQKEA